jgi:hypothetical protein
VNAQAYPRPVEDLGPPIAYTALEDGTPVYDRQGIRIGVAEHIVGEPEADIFDGVIIHTEPLPGRHLFAGVDQIAELRERGVVLSVGADALHEPDERPTERPDHHDDRAESPLQATLRRAWDRISGRR